MQLKSRTGRTLLFTILSFVYFCEPQLAVAQNDSPSDTDVSLTQTIEAAKDGDAAAQFALGLQYYLGRDVPQDYAQAAEWIRRAAEQGHVDAQYMLGLFYDKGRGVSKNDAQAVEWYRKAAEQGNATAQYNLGVKYTKGLGVPRDDVMAAKWFRKAAEQGDTQAQFMLSLMYADGRGVPKDDAQVIEWFRKAAEQGHADAQFGLGLMYADGRGVPKDDAQAVGWFRKAAEQGNAAAQFNLGVRYSKGEGVKKDETRAVKWYQMAANQGLANAQFQLGYSYWVGKGVMKSDTNAVKWYKLAAEQGNGKAQSNLGVMYAIGDGVPLDDIQAYTWFNIASANGIEGATEARERISKRMTREQIAEAQRISAAFHPSSNQADPTGVRPKPAKPTVHVFGSGFFITSNGYFVTNNHVIADAQRIRIMTDSGMHEATVVRADPTNDLALLKVTGTFPALFVRGSRSVRAADRVATIGFPNPSLQGLESKYGSGVVSSITGPNDDPRFFQISVPIQPGNSGGPLLDASGAVVGVVAAKLDQILTFKSIGSIPENVGYAIKGTILLGFMESVPNLMHDLSPDPGTKPMDPADLAEMANDAIGMVSVER